MKINFLYGLKSGNQVFVLLVNVYQNALLYENFKYLQNVQIYQNYQMVMHLHRVRHMDRQCLLPVTKVTY